MNRRNEHFIISLIIRSSFLLALVCLSHSSSFNHLSHIHDDDLIELEIGPRNINFDAEQLSDNHHDGDHSHKFDTKIESYILGTRFQQTIRIADPCFISIIPFHFNELKNSLFLVNEQVSIIDKHFIQYQIIRGPPFFA